MNPPLWSPRFRLTGTVLEYKPFPAYYTWLTLVDFTGTDIATTEAVAALVEAYQLASVPGIIEALITIDSQITGLGTVIASNYTELVAAIALKADLDAFNTQIADINQQIDDLQAAGSSPLPMLATLWADETFWSIGSPQTINNVQEQRYQYFTYTDSDGDTFQRNFIVRAGDYTLSWLGIREADGGLVDVYVDDVLKGTFYFYNSSTEYNVEQGLSLTGLSAGEHTLKCVTNGHPVGSIGYAAYVTRISIKNNADV